MGWVQRWSDEHSDDGGQELQFLVVGRWELSVWLHWANWQVGPSAEREYGGGAWPDRLHLTFGLGPILLSAMRTWNEPDR